jgi:PIN domain nuclease of toxin-antitoxin system
MARKYVLDTHAILWYLEGNPRLAPAAKSIIDEPAAELVLPVIALAEAAFVVERRRSNIPSVASLLASIQADPRIEVYPVTLEIFQQSLTAQTIPELHDRLIVATVLHLIRLGHSVRLLTRDSIITNAHLVPVVW